jgi:hypothetical protein
LAVASASPPFAAAARSDDDDGLDNPLRRSDDTAAVNGGDPL